MRRANHPWFCTRIITTASNVNLGGKANFLWLFEGTWSCMLLWVPRGTKPCIQVGVGEKKRSREWVGTAMSLPTSRTERLKSIYGVPS